VLTIVHLDLSVSGDFALTANYKTYELYNWKTGENLWSFVEGDSSYTVLLKDNIAITGTGANGDTKVRFYDINTKTKIAESAGMTLFKTMCHDIVLPKLSECDTMTL
jgi:hypothetical protein